MANIYMETFNTYNRYEQELMFLNQKYAWLLNQNDEDQWWFNDFQAKLAEYNINVDKKTLREKGLLDILSQLSDDDNWDIINIFFWIQDKAGNKNEEELNQIFLSWLLSDISRYKSVKQEKEKLLADENQRAIIQRMEKIIKKDLITTLKTEKTLLESWEKVNYTWKGKKFSRARVRGAGDSKEGQENFNSKELHDNFTTSILSFHDIEKIYQKYKYVFTLRDLKDAHTILDSLKHWEMVMMTWDTWSWKTELSLLLASLYLDRIYWDSPEREKKKPILVTWNTDTDFSDLTVEKIITSKNIISDQNDAIVWDEEEKTGTESVLYLIEKERKIRAEAERLIDSNDEYSEEEKAKRKESLENFDMFKYNIFTDFHLQWITKAMKNGVPLILDEINGISPEVLLWLNHYFTRKVGQTISIGNWFEPITIKEWFCIICTWNDKNENSKIMRYQWRYDIDESLMNRMYRVCKWYYKQDVSEKEYENRNESVENQEEQVKSQIEYMNENELYWVILMLCFNKKSNDKNINEISDETVLKKIIDTETVWFDLIKESFSWQSFAASKEQVFNELKSLAKFIHYVQEAYQWHSVIFEGKKVQLNNASFSMRQLVEIIQDWKTDTKSLWYHIYNDYVKQIPSENTDRYRIYRIAQESWFIDKESNHIENNSDDIKSMTEFLERRQNEEFHSWANTRNAQIKESNVTDEILDSHLIITKQDIYKEYFGEQFWKVDDWEFEKQIEQEKKEISEKEGIQEQSESLEDIKARIITTLDEISYFMSDESNNFRSQIPFEVSWSLDAFCEKNERTWEYEFMDRRANNPEFWDDVFIEVDKCLWAMLEEFQNWVETWDIDPELITNLVHTLENIGKEKE